MFGKMIVIVKRIGDQGGVTWKDDSGGVFIIIFFRRKRRRGKSKFRNLKLSVSRNQ